MIALPEDKSAARAVLRARRRERASRESAADRAQHGAALRDHLAPLVQQLGPAAVVASFVSLPREPPTELLNADLTQRGLDLIVPILLADNDLDWRRIGEHQPIGRSAVGAATLLIVPALAVDRNGMRLGQGGGSYDRALARVARQVPVLAVVHDDEIVQQVPAAAHDRPVTAVVTHTAGIRTLT